MPQSHHPYVHQQRSSPERPHHHHHHHHHHHQQPPTPNLPNHPYHHPYPPVEDRPYYSQDIVHSAPAVHSPPRPTSQTYGNPPSARSSYYDPVDRREPPVDWQFSPTRPQPVREPYIYPDASTDRPRSPPPPASPLDNHPRQSYSTRSPVAASHPHRDIESRSAYTTPAPMDYPNTYTNGNTPVSPVTTQPSAPSSARKGAMSLSALLNDEPAPALPPPALSGPVPEPIAAVPAPALVPTVVTVEPKPKRKYTRRQPSDNQIKAEAPPLSTRSRNVESRHRKSPSISESTKGNMDIDVDDHEYSRKPTSKDNHISHIDVEELEAAGPDFDDAVYEPVRLAYVAKVKKRHVETEKLENEKRKRRRLFLQTKYHGHFISNAATARVRASKYFQDAASKVISEKEQIEDKERKKEMQRKRRREKAAIDAAAKAEAAAKAAAEAAEKERLEREKAREEGRPYPPDERGTLLTFKGYDNGADFDSESMGQPGDDEPRKSRRKPGPKPRRRPPGATNTGTDDGKDPRDAKPARSRPLKKAGEKDKEIVREDEVKAEEFKIKEEEVLKEVPREPSKIYHQMYDQIWKDMSRKDVPKVYKQQQSSFAIKQSNLRKTTQLAAKEARRWQQRTNKNTKDVQARAKRCMREMISFWKRNERDERDSRRRAEKEALERARKEEEMRESKRQARKLNFLISQTELYSHFIGRKVKTDEVERSTDNGAVGQAIKSSMAEATEAEKLGNKVTKIDEIDFDDSDDEKLNLAAKTNAHMAVEEARLKAQAFNQANGDAKMDISKVNLDEDEMNFQNPTSLGDIYIDQPKMLNCQLKEYQLKGLNWLVNLYEQGINGILADEMGLGKTVQSISVMAYLAEYHNIWGPFLVIAPASTLHNWQQEIARFVPELKILPYWGNTKDRKILRKYWDRRNLTYTKDSPFHVLITSYQLVVQDVIYFQKMRWQYMILDEAQAIKSSSSSRWKALLAFHCRNRLLLTGTPIQNSMQELWALLHFIMPTLFDSHDEFSEWFSKDIESHAQSNTQLNEAQLRRLHMILKPFMLRRIKKHVQSELGDKIEIDVYCQLTYRQRHLYRGLRDQINLIDIVEKSIMGGDEGSQSLMNLVMQFRKVCNHPDLFERAETRSPLSFARFPETASFMREGSTIDVPYSVRNFIEYNLPRMIYRGDGRLDFPSYTSKAGFGHRYLDRLMNIWTPDAIEEANKADNSAFSWLRFADTSIQEASQAFHTSVLDRALSLRSQRDLSLFPAVYDEEGPYVPAHALLMISETQERKPLADITSKNLANLMNVSRTVFEDERLHRMEPLASPKASAPPISLQVSDQGTAIEQNQLLFSGKIRKALYGPSAVEEQHLLDANVMPICFPTPKLLPEPISEVSGFNSIQVPSMRRFVADSGKLAKLDSLLKELKDGGHRVLLYFQMTRMIDLMEEYLSYRQYRYLRLDGSSKLEDRRDMVMDWQTKPEIFIFLLSTRAGGLGINLTAADTVIFYDSDWNPTIDSQAMDRAHRLGQTRQVTVYRLITRGTIEERILQRAKQKASVQQVVVGNGDVGEFAGRNVDFNEGARQMAYFLMNDEDDQVLQKQLEMRQKEKDEEEARKTKPGPKKGTKRKKLGASALDGVNSLEDMYHEGEGHFDDGSSAKPTEGATATTPSSSRKKAGGTAKAKTTNAKSHRRKSTKERLAYADGTSGNNFDPDNGPMED